MSTLVHVALTEEDANRIFAFSSAAVSPATARKRRAVWGVYTAWCASRGLSPLPSRPEAVAAYLAALADGQIEREHTDPRPLARKVSTILGHLIVIRAAHRMSDSDFDSENKILVSTVEGIKRKLGTKQEQKKAASGEEMESMADSSVYEKNGARRQRDLAMILCGFYGAMRRSELCSMSTDNTNISKSGIEIFLARSKTDQTGKGRTIRIPAKESYCAVAATKAWMGLAGITGGPMWRGVDRHGNVSESALSEFGFIKRLKQLVRLSGLDEREFSGHSLRSGFVTEALGSGIDSVRVAEVTGHKNISMVLRYLRPSDPWKNAAADIKIG